MKKWSEPFTTGAEARARDVPISSDSLHNYFEDLIKDSPTVRRSGGVSHQSAKALRRKILRQWCAGCGTKRTSDETVCQNCGTIIGDGLGPTRHARIPPEYKALLDNSPDLRLRHVLAFLTHTKRWRDGDLIQWAAAFANGKQSERGPRGGRPRNFGNDRGEKVQDRLPIWLELRLKEGGVSFAPGAPLHFSACCLMAFDLYVAAKGLLLPSNSPLQSSHHECRELTELIARPDLDTIILAALQRNTA